MPNLDQNNIQSVEFEAPLSADASSAPPGRHFSIDLSLELERELDMESYPPTPSHITEAHTQQNPNRITRDSLDPQILAHIIKQLRQSLVEVTKDRDELLEMVALSTTHETELQEALQQMTDKATKMEVELSDARKKMQDDEDSINMLRTKVEESRRGLMRLQTESRRQSITPTSLELSRAGLASLGNQPSSKRASFVPLTGRPGGHRRISSVSDSGVFDFGANNPQTLTLPEGSSLLARRPSSTYGRISPSQIDVGHSDQVATETESLRREARMLKDELEHAKHELLESNEAREASETCVKALREFIEQNNVGALETSGLNTVKLPPTMSNGPEEDEAKKTGGVTAWGFKLWKDATLRTPIAPQSATVPQSTSESLPQGPASATPLSRKLGGLFSTRSSVSSVGTNTSQNESATPQLQTNAARSVRDSIHSSSDASSVVEPISPPAEITTQPYHVLVRDVTNSNSSDSGSVRLSPNLRGELKKVHVDDVSFRPPVVVG